jgi:hypothetical protein
MFTCKFGSSLQSSDVCYEVRFEDSIAGRFDLAHLTTKAAIACHVQKIHNFNIVWVLVQNIRI